MLTTTCSASMNAARQAARAFDEKREKGEWDYRVQEKVRPDRRADWYRLALDGFWGLDRAVRTYADGLSVGVGDTLSAVNFTSWDCI